MIFKSSHLTEKSATMIGGAGFISALFTYQTVEKIGLEPAAVILSVSSILTAVAGFSLWSNSKEKSYRNISKSRAVCEMFGTGCIIASIISLRSVLKILPIL